MHPLDSSYLIVRSDIEDSLKNKIGLVLKRLGIQEPNCIKSKIIGIKSTLPSPPLTY
jgi:hypothetical protein